MAIFNNYLFSYIFSILPTTIPEASLNLVTKGIITLDSAIVDSGLKKEEFLSIAKSLGYKL